MNSFDNIDREYAYDGELGAVWSPEATRFAVWSPETESVELRLYHDDSETEPFRTEEMHSENGVWKAEVSGDLSGVYYTYAFTRNGNTAETIDIYARSAGVNGRRGMVLDLRTTDPEGWERDRQVSLGDYTDAVIYELHVRDFSPDESGNFTLRGKFGAFCEKAVNGFGETIGLDYIKKRVFYVGSRTNSIFKSYVISNLVDALIIFVAMAIGCLVMGMPYPMLLAVVCGVTNLIPFFGPFIGAIPCGILILLVDPVKVIWFELFVLVLQQLDGKPHLFGGSMGLPAIWVLVSITIGGGLFGIPGMLLGVPVFAVIYLLFAEFVSSRLKKKKMPEETREYAGDTSLFLDGYEDGSVSEEPALVREEKKGD